MTNTFTIALLIALVLVVRKNMKTERRRRHRKGINAYFNSEKGKRDMNAGWEYLRQLKWRSDTTPPQN